MIAERHNDRLNLIRRARSLLQASGELHGPTINVGDHEFQAGDEVLCRTPRMTSSLQAIPTATSETAPSAESSKSSVTGTTRVGSWSTLTIEARSTSQ